jgi:large subunit ribosomal protein L35
VLSTPGNVPFEHVPYQCFQEARNVLQADREEKLKQIEAQRRRIEQLRLQMPTKAAEQLKKENRLRSMEKYLEQLKILADINDPLVKMRFEDGLGKFAIVNEF